MSYAAQDEASNEPGDLSSDVFGPFLSRESFWVPARSGEKSGWVEHAPFAFWLMATLRPGRFIELGSHTGYSYSAFCQVVQNLGLSTRCYAVDTWHGDEHAGFYGDDIFQDLFEFNNDHYARFSRLVRSTFNQALEHFEDGSVDLLHIDGRHGYNDVQTDFDNWRPKLSSDAIVIFHDTNVRERGFGVARFWDEIRQGKPHFTFLHGNGLGILGYGDVSRSRLRALFACSADPKLCEQVREAYGRLGSALTTRYTKSSADELRIHQLTSTLNKMTVDFADLQNANAVLLGDRDREVNLTRIAEAELEAVKQDASRRSARVNYLHGLLGHYTHQAEITAARQSEMDKVAARLSTTLAALEREREERQRAERHLALLQVVDREAVIDRLTCRALAQDAEMFAAQSATQSLQVVSAERDRLRNALVQLTGSRIWRLRTTIHRLLGAIR